MRFAQFAVNVMGCVMDYQNPEKTALEGICAMERFFTSIHMPTSISQMGIILSDEQIECLAEKCTDGGSKNIGAFCRLGKEDIRKIYTMAR